MFFSPSIIKVVLVEFLFSKQSLKLHPMFYIFFLERQSFRDLHWATMTQCYFGAPFISSNICSCNLNILFIKTFLLIVIPVCESIVSSYSVTKNKKAETFQRKSFILKKKIFDFIALSNLFQNRIPLLLLM